MFELPKVRKSAGRGMTHREKVKKALLGVAVGVGVAVAGVTQSASVDAAKHSITEPVRTVEQGAMVLQPPQVDEDTVAYHYSHRSHYSHSSHQSHHSHYSSRY